MNATQAVEPPVCYCRLAFNQGGKISRHSVFGGRNGLCRFQVLGMAVGERLKPPGEAVCRPDRDKQRRTEEDRKFELSHGAPEPLLWDRCGLADSELANSTARTRPTTSKNCGIVWALHPFSLRSGQIAAAFGPQQLAWCLPFRQLAL